MSNTSTIPLKESLYWAYANLAISHIAVSKGDKSYSGVHYGIRRNLYNALLNETKNIGTLFADEKVKMAVSMSCCYCGSKNHLATEHLLPKKRGGKDSGDNLITACRSCNSAKRDKDMLAWFAERNAIPTILLYRRYLKLAIEYAKQHDLMNVAVNALSPEVFPFNYEHLISSPLDLDKAVLWVAEYENLPRREKSNAKKQFVIANWNLEKPKRKSAKLNRALTRIEQINPDLIVLTENTTVVDSLSEYEVMHCEPYGHNPSSYCASIYSKWKIIENVSVKDAGHAVCALVDSPFGHLLVFGCIIPYHMSGVNNGKHKGLNYKAWQLHQEMIEVFKNDWKCIQARYPGTPLIVMGDFNQTRGVVKGYGTAKVREHLTDALSATSLECLTEIDFGKLGLLKPDVNGKVRKNIDHICINDRFRKLTSKIEVDAWEHFDESGLAMSDHNGVLIRFRH